MLTTDGITFSSIGARLGICCALVAEDAVSAALAESGDNARPKLRASALIANVVFHQFQSQYQVTKVAVYVTIRVIL